MCIHVYICLCCVLPLTTDILKTHYHPFSSGVLMACLLNPWRELYIFFQPSLGANLLTLLMQNLSFLSKSKMKSVEILIQNLSRISLSKA